MPQVMPPRAAVDGEGLGERRLHPAGDHRGVVGLVELARDHHEVVLAEVGGEVAGAERLADAPGGEAQHLVAGARARASRAAP